MTSKVSSPNSSTMRCAVLGPIPLIAPDARYRSMDAASAGILRSQLSTRNCPPYLGLCTHFPYTVTLSPSPMYGIVPVSVTRSPASVPRSQMAKPFSSFA